MNLQNVLVNVHVHVSWSSWESCNDRLPRMIDFCTCMCASWSASVAELVEHFLIQAKLTFVARILKTTDAIYTLQVEKLSGHIATVISETNHKMVISLPVNWLVYCLLPNTFGRTLPTTQKVVRDLSHRSLFWSWVNCRAAILYCFRSLLV